jgi:hypothetical protein
VELTREEGVDTARGVRENHGVEFVGDTGDRLSLRVVDYEDPRDTSDHFGSNWLSVELSACRGGQAWRVLSPCLLTWELEWIARWMESAAAGEPFDRSLDFVEPCLLFEWIGRSEARTEFRVYFELDCRPPWDPAHQAHRKDCCVTLHADPAEMNRAAEDVRRQRSLFPTRAGVGTTEDLPWAIQGLERR